MFGVELELLYRPTAHDQIGVNYAYAQSQWVNKPAAFAAAQPETYRAMTPHTVTANYRHNFDLPGGSTITAAIDGRYDAGHLGANSQHDLVTAPPSSCYTYPVGVTCTVDWRNYARVPTETVGNAQITWSSPGRSFSVTGFVRNFTDARYTTYTVGPQPFNVNYTDPRVFGVTLSGRF